jgi:hypothetical protein
MIAIIALGLIAILLSAIAILILPLSLLLLSTITILILPVSVRLLSAIAVLVPAVSILLLSAIPILLLRTIAILTIPLLLWTVAVSVGLVLFPWFFLWRRFRLVFVLVVLALHSEYGGPEKQRQRHGC